MNLPIEIKTGIYEHIGIVQKHLSTFPPDEQREILQALEMHIYDALESRTSGTPTPGLLEAIIAEMDPPESYGSAPENSIPPSAKKNRSSLFIAFASALGASALTFFLVSNMQEKCAIISNEPAVGITQETLELKQKKQPLVTGKWAGVDFVSNASEFIPGQTNFPGQLALKGLTFLADGKTTKPWWTWKNNILIHHGDKSAAEFTIKTIGTNDFMFLEWISGDVRNLGIKPEYYVLQRGEYTEPSPLDEMIVPGVGCGEFKVGTSKEELIAAMGEPDKTSTDTWLRWDNHSVHVTFYGGDLSRELRFNQGFKGKTEQGIGINSTKTDVIKAYGKPDHEIDQNGGTKLEWSNKGLLIWLTPENKVNQIVVLKPHPAHASQPIKKDIQQASEKTDMDPFEEIAKAFEVYPAKTINEFIEALPPFDRAKIRKLVGPEFQTMFKEELTIQSHERGVVIADRSGHAAFVKWFDGVDRHSLTEEVKEMYDKSGGYTAFGKAFHSADNLLDGKYSVHICRKSIFICKHETGEVEYFIYPNEFLEK